MQSVLTNADSMILVIMGRSSSGPGREVFTLVTGVRFSVALLISSIVKLGSNPRRPTNQSSEVEMAAAKPKHFLITDVHGEWSVGPVEAIDAAEAVIEFEKSQDGSGKLGSDLIGNQYDVYEVVAGPTKLKAVVGITER
jgi:hypothetical protein